MNERQINDQQLCAYADQRLEPAEQARIEALLSAEPGLAARVGDWRRQSSGLHELYDPVLSEAIPERLLAAATGRRAASARPAGPRLRWAAAIAWVALGGVLGYGLRAMDAPPPAVLSTQLSLPRQAAIAHAVYVPEVRHPVEVGAEQQAHLVGWLSKRLGVTIRTPSLDEDGYALMGGRLLPGGSGPVAQFMYQDGAGQRLTLYLTHGAMESQDTAFRFADEGGVSVFYWVDGGTGYALSGELPRDRLLQIATRVYRQLNP